MPTSTKTHVDTVRKVFGELRSIGPSLGGGICRVPLGKIEKCTWKMGSTCGRMSAMIMSETKTPKARVASAR